MQALCKKVIHLSKIKSLWATLWATLWVIWFVILWKLSSGGLPEETPQFEIPHLDKVMHFVYFAAGAICATVFLLIKGEDKSKWAICLVVLLLGVSVGALDEWHQSWIPERSGNDPFDLLADAVGTLFGFFFAATVWPFWAKLKL